MHAVAGRDPGSRVKVFFLRFFTFCKLLFKLFTKKSRGWDYVVLTIFTNHKGLPYMYKTEFLEII